MKRGTFLAFVGPSLALMFLFIAAPLVGVVVQSFRNEQRVYHDQTSENCTPGFPDPVCTTVHVSVPDLDPTGRPLTKDVFVGLDNYRALLQPAEVAAAFGPGGDGLADVMRLDFYSALAFTVGFTFVTLPLVIGVGLGLAFALNATVKSLRGPVIFVSLLPFIITPVIGALSIRWLFVEDGILADALQAILHHRVSMFSRSWTIELLMVFYRVWSVGPFAFIIFYAGLQTMNLDTLAAAMVDGATRFQRLRFVVLPHLSPLIVFVALIHLMDSYRVFDEIVGFASQAHVISLQWLTFDLLTPNSAGVRAIGRASASSMLTMIGIVLILIPLIARTWREHRHG